MGRALHDADAGARALFAEADAVLGYPLSKICFEGPEEALTATANAQPAILTVSIAALGFLRARTAAAPLRELGADPATAWAPPAGDVDEQCRALLRLARRSAASGAALADSVAELAVESRHDAARAADAAAERAGVVIAGPLGICFLPAFICLGVVPVVAGLAGNVFSSVLL